MPKQREDNNKGLSHPMHLLLSTTSNNNDCSLLSQKARVDNAVMEAITQVCNMLTPRVLKSDDVQ